MRVTKKVNGMDVEVPLEQVWNSLCKVIWLARILTSVEADEEGKTLTARRAFLQERLTDLEGLHFHFLGEEKS